MVLRSRRLIVVLLAIFTAAATILTVRVARRPATRLSSIHFVSADGRRLSGLFDGARRDPAAVARFAMMSRYWKEARRYPSCYLKSVRSSQASNPSFVERWKTIILASLPQFPEVVHAYEPLPIWGREVADCPSEECVATLCTFDEMYCGCIEEGVKCGDGGYCYQAMVARCP
jgi:hypothetical protein